MDLKLNELMNRFVYHKPNEKKVIIHQALRDEFLALAEFVYQTCPEGRERSLAWTKLEEAMFWANASIARSE